MMMNLKCFTITMAATAAMILAERGLFVEAQQMQFATEGTCESNGWQAIYDNVTCISVINNVGGDFESAVSDPTGSVVDGCSTDDSDLHFIEEGSCNSTKVGDCLCSTVHMCVCVLAFPPTEPPTQAPRTDAPTRPPTAQENENEEETSLVSWVVQKSDTIVASVVSKEGRFQVTMNFIAKGMDTMSAKMTLLKNDCSGSDLAQGLLTSDIVLTLDEEAAFDGSKNLTATFNISKTLLVNNTDVWVADTGATSGNATMCTRLELMSSSSTEEAISMTFLETLMELIVDFKTDFTTVKVVNITAADRAVQDDLESDAFAEDETVSACHCGSDGVCYDIQAASASAPALSQGSILNICLTSPADTELASVSSLTLTQAAMLDGTIGYTFQAITGGTANVGTVVNLAAGRTTVIQVIMVSPFYLTQSAPQAVSAAGDVVLKLAGGAEGSRRLVIMGADQAATAKNMEMASTRALKARTPAEAGTPFEVVVELAQNMNESQDGSAAFMFIHSKAVMIILSTIVWAVAVAAI